MAAIITVSAIVSVVPITTSGSWTGFATLPTTCPLAPGQISCVVTGTSATNKTNSGSALATTTNTVIRTSTSTAQAITSTLEGSTQSNPTTHSSSQAAAVGVPAQGSNQVGIALGVAFALLVLLALGWLLFAWRTRRCPFHAKPAEGEEDGVPMAEVAGRADSEARDYMGPVPRESPSRPVSETPSNRPPCPGTLRKSTRTRRSSARIVPGRIQQAVSADEHLPSPKTSSAQAASGSKARTIFLPFDRIRRMDSAQSLALLHLRHRQLHLFQHSLSRLS